MVGGGVGTGSRVGVDLSGRIASMLTWVGVVGMGWIGQDPVVALGHGKRRGE